MSLMIVLECIKIFKLMQFSFPNHCKPRKLPTESLDVQTQGVQARGNRHVELHLALLRWSESG